MMNVDVTSEDIRPAVDRGTPAAAAAAPTTADDFQKQLCAWLQNRGMLGDLRAYFKSNMIEALKNSSAGPSLGLRPPQAPSSPKMQAINLLLAEYLSQSRYYFSLCVFGTEVALNKVFYNCRERFKFNQSEVFDILETLGIMRHNKQAKCIYLLYKQGEDPLLNYFLPAPPVYRGITESCKDYIFSAVDNELDLGIQNINRILLNSNISPEEVNQLKYCVKWICDRHKAKEKQLEANLKIEFKTQLGKYKQKLHEVEKIYEIERANLRSEVVRLKEQLSEMISNQKPYEKRFSVECPLHKANMPKLVIPDNSISKSKAVSTASNMALMETKASQCEILVSDPEKVLLKEAIKKLEQENDLLRSDNRGFSQELDHLALRASNLMAELNISQQNILRLNGILHSNVDVTRQLPINVNPHRVLSYTGAGEEYLRTNSVIPPQYRHTSRVPKRRPRVTSPSSSSRSASPTESILRDAKQKLKHLEEESMNIEKMAAVQSRTPVGKVHRHHLPSTPMSSPCEGRSRTVFEFGTNNENKELQGQRVSSEESYDSERFEKVKTGTSETVGIQSDNKDEVD